MVHGARVGGKGRWTLACVVLTIAVFGTTAAASEIDDQVTIKPGNPATNFTGTDKNTSASTHNFISIGTAGPTGQENNPITSFTYNGQQCQLYSAKGSAYCSVTLPPGATATFSGTTQSPTSSFTFCTSDDGGLDNNCFAVTASSGTTIPPATCAPTSLLAMFVHLDRDMSAVINGAQAGNLHGASLAAAIKRLVSEKQSLIGGGGFRGQSVFGVPVSTVILKFDLIDLLLERATAGAHAGTGTNGVGVALAYLEGAKKAKQQLEKAFQPCQ